MITTIIWRRTIVLALLAIASSGTATLQAQDTIISRLESAGYINLSYDARLDSFTIVTYTPEEQAKKVVLGKKLRAEIIADNEKLAEIEKRQAATKEASDGPFKAMSEERQVLLKRIGDNKEEVRKIHRVVKIGTDYIEVQSIENLHRNQLIPLHKIRSVYVIQPNAKELPDSDQPK